MKTKNIIIAVAALATGAAAGWFAGGFVKGRQHAGGVGVSPAQCDGQGVHRASKAPSPRRRAPFRSTADAEVQRLILKANIAALEKRLAAAKKEAERIAAARAALKATGAESSADLDLQLAEAVKRLKEEGKKRTVGEMRRLAPEWFENASRWTYGKGDAFRRRTVEMLEILTALDVSGRTDKEREVHAKYMGILADAAQKFDAKIDAVTDDTPTGEFFGINNEIFMQTGKSLGKDKLMIREQKMLRDLTLRNLGFSAEEMSEMMSALKEASAAIYASVPNMNEGMGRLDAKKGKEK